MNGAEDPFARTEGGLSEKEGPTTRKSGRTRKKEDRLARTKGALPQKEGPSTEKNGRASEKERGSSLLSSHFDSQRHVQLEREDRFRFDTNRSSRRCLSERTTARAGSRTNRGALPAS